jgi:hypothetical protein
VRRELSAGGDLGAGRMLGTDPLVNPTLASTANSLLVAQDQHLDQGVDVTDIDVDALDAVRRVGDSPFYQQDVLRAHVHVGARLRCRP